VNPSSTPVRWAGIAYVVVTFLSFPHPLAVLPGGVLDLGVALSWFSPAFLFLAIDGLAPRNALWRGLMLGMVSNAAILHWAYVVTVDYGKADPLLGLLAPPGMALYTTVFVGALAAASAYLRQRGLGRIFVLAALWVAVDSLRGWVLGGFPWATIGYAQHLNRLLLGIVTLTGVYGLSFVVVLGGATIAEFVRYRRFDFEMRAAVACILLLHALGPFLYADEVPTDAETVRIGAVQGNVSQDAKWLRERFSETLVDYERGTLEAAVQGAQLVVWPESAMTRPVQLDRGLRSRLSMLARDSGAALVVGSVGTEVDARGVVSNYFDSAFTIAPDGGWLTRYDKTHLVPFGEYLPLRRWIGRIAEAVATGIAKGDVTPGVRPFAVDLPLASPSSVDSPGHRSVRAGIPICYELLFPDLVRRFVEDEAGVLLAITNDAWYGRTGAPYQFLAMTALRSAESGVWTVRAANTGVTAVIDGRGRVRERTEIFEPAVLVADVPIRPRGFEPTFYVRYGDVFAGACSLAVLAALVIAWRRREDARPEEAQASR